MPEPQYFSDNDPTVRPESLSQSSPNTAWSSQAMGLITQRDGGAGWLHAIAAFSLINLIVLCVGAGINFLIGLAVTQFIHVISISLAAEMGPQFMWVGWAISIVCTLGIAGLFLGLGMLAKRGFVAAFVVGMMLYAADGLLYLLLQDWLSVGFHVFVLVMLFQGLKAQWQLNQLQRAEELAPRTSNF